MTYSPLTDEVMPPTGEFQGQEKWQNRPRDVDINGLNVHHHAATNDSGIYRLVESDDPASANYIIRNNGSLIGSVPEEYRAWTTSSYAADDDKITVEVQNETGAPEWRISDAAMATLIRLYADLALRHKFATTRGNIWGHQQYAATACPGPFLYPRLGYVAEQATLINSQEEFLMALSDANQDKMFIETTTEVEDGDRKLPVREYRRVNLALLRRIEKDNAEERSREQARAAADRARDLEQQKQIAGLTALATTMAQNQGIPVEQMMAEFRAAISSIKVVVSADL